MNNEGFSGSQNPTSYFTLPVILYNMISFIFILSAQIVIAWKTSTCRDIGSHLVSCCRCFGPKKEQKVLSSQQKREEEKCTEECFSLFLGIFVVGLQFDFFLLIFTYVQ